MKTARSGSSPIPSTARSAAQLCSWRPKALRRAVASIRPGGSRSQTIIPAQVPKPGPPASWKARIGPPSPADSIPLTIVVLSPPGITRPSRPSRSSGVRTSHASAPSSRSIAACASKPPCIARTPIRRPAPSGTAALQERVGRGELGNLQPRHRLAEADRGGGDPLGGGGGRRRLAYRPRPALRVGALEDPGADEVALGTELHHQRRVGWGRDPPPAHEPHRHAGPRRPPP